MSHVAHLVDLASSLELQLVEATLQFDWRSTFAERKRAIRGPAQTPLGRHHWLHGRWHDSSHPTSIEVIVSHHLVPSPTDLLVVFAHTNVLARVDPPLLSGLRLRQRDWTDGKRSGAVTGDLAFDG